MSLLLQSKRAQVRQSEGIPKCQFCFSQNVHRSDSLKESQNVNFASDKMCKDSLRDSQNVNFATVKCADSLMESQNVNFAFVATCTDSMRVSQNVNSASVKTCTDSQKRFSITPSCKIFR